MAKETLEKASPLQASHEASGAKLMPFAGYKLPAWFSSVRDEHMAVRKNLGIFDISHMCPIRFTGTAVAAFLQRVSCNAIHKADGNRTVYSMLLNEAGGVIDDVMISQLAEDDYLLICNAANEDAVMEHLKSQAVTGVQIHSLRDSHGLLAIQGPNAIQWSAQNVGVSAAEMPRLSVMGATILGAPSWVLRSGYTGEDGIEILAPKDCIQRLWDTAIAKGVSPCGLAARDSLRIEAGLPLYGQELSTEISPLMTRYTWVLSKDENYIGREATETLRDSGVELKSVGLHVEGRAVPRTGYEIQEGGYVSSGTFSFCLDHPIAMAFVPKALSEPGTELHIMIRNQAVPAKVVKLPFLSQS